MHFKTESMNYLQIRIVATFSTCLVPLLTCSAEHDVVDKLEISPNATEVQRQEARELFEQNAMRRYFGTSLPDPHALHLMNPMMNGETISPLGDLIGLREVFLAGVAIDDDDLRHLARLRELESLSLSGTSPNVNQRTMSLNGEGLQHLAGLPKLRSMWLNNLALDPGNYALLADAPNLKELFVSESRLLDDRPQWPKESSADAMLASLSKLKSLKKLILHTEEKTAGSGCFENWQSAHGLSELDVRGVAISRPGWSGLSRFTSLELLNYEARQHTIDWDALAEIPNLRELHLPAIRDEELAGIEKCEQVRRLFVGGGVTDKGVEHIGQMQNLESLTLWYSPISGSGFEEASKLELLTTLNVTGTQLNDAGLQHVAQLPALETLILQGSRVTPDGMRALIQTKGNLKRVGPPIPKYEIGSELRNPFWNVAREIQEASPQIEFDFSPDIAS
ncbi:MAG: hypothetical protein R3C18_05270 [Planctomycetaceae bacterium]